MTAELSLVKKGFDRQKGDPPMLSPSHPRYAGSALWAKSLLLRVQRQWLMLEGSSKTAEDLARKTAEAKAAFEVRSPRSPISSPRSPISSSQSPVSSDDLPSAPTSSPTLS